MGSRRGRHAALVAALGASIALSFGCTQGAPPGFSGGDQWVIPLIGPLEDGLLLVPVIVNDKGPYVFALDPDAHVSIIDEEVLKASEAHTGQGPKLLDESDTQQTRFFAEILSWQLGDLTVRGPKPAQVVGKGTFDADGRRIYGVIGRDVIADSLVLTIHRDDGILVLQTQKKATTPTSWTPIKYSKLQSNVPNVDVAPLPRRLVKVTVGGNAFPLHLDLGATYSQLRPRAWGRAKLAVANQQLGIVDEVGMVRKVTQTGTAESVSIGNIVAKNLSFVPYDDRRWPDQDIEGTVGLDFFADYDVMVNWDNDTFYMKPRDPKALANVIGRLGRWQSKLLLSCKTAGCAKVTATDPFAGKPADQLPEKHPGIVVSVTRDEAAKNFNLEVLIAVTPAAGKGPLKWLVANMPGSADRAMTHLPADYLGATFTVVDVSSFPRTCPTEGSCIDLLAAPREFVPPAASPAATPPAAPEAPAPAPAAAAPADPPAAPTAP